jgi:Cu-Zn family superoxide dismutase
VASDTFTRRATATLLDLNGHVVGTVQFTEGANAGVAVVAQFSGLAAGQHGIHLHAVGSCDPAATFSTAGSHFNPDGRKHGLETADGPHAGDLPNVIVIDGGIGLLTTVTKRFTLGAGATSLLDADGSAVVLHAAVDDQHTDPSGNSGARIACGVVIGS